ncbi:MAG: M48 family metallopeptidase [Pseudomonadota bacterium]
MRWIGLVAASFLAGCLSTTEDPGPKEPTQQQAAARTIKKPNSAQVARFKQVVKRVEPVAERYCRQRTEGSNCDFKIIVDDRPNLPPNAYQTLDKNGRPILAFTPALIADVRNSDEIAFILSHEAAHHVRGHIPRQQQNATVGALVVGSLAGILGAGSSAVQNAANVGATVGARTYSKDFELEADATGTVIAKQAGYNPVRGAEYFNRIPDPGDVFLGTHPPNAQRVAIVKKTAAGL